MCEKEPIENWMVRHGNTVDYACAVCNKWIHKPEIAIVKRIGKNRFKVVDAFCSQECYNKFET